jgi:hypothetical protein
MNKFRTLAEIQRINEFSTIDIYMEGLKREYISKEDLIKAINKLKLGQLGIVLLRELERD